MEFSVLYPVTQLLQYLVPHVFLSIDACFTLGASPRLSHNESALVVSRATMQDLCRAQCTARRTQCSPGLTERFVVHYVEEETGKLNPDPLMGRINGTNTAAPQSCFFWHACC